MNGFDPLQLMILELQQVNDWFKTLKTKFVSISVMTKICNKNKTKSYLITDLNDMNPYNFRDVLFKVQSNGSCIPESL